ncbi:MAG: PD-(D/E)XK nuclease family protein [Chloroflexi bacterium]|nr:PD-(D/E)XK nuclease family protein [Chloroflexota bacterium]MBM4453888.1 PD-(D/E)XK nuclease family protein [Chloroflexota bacterium]
MAVYSHSQLSMYEECPRKYKLYYRDKIRPDTEAIELFLGSRVHEALKKCYDDLKFMKVCSLEELLAYYRNIWHRNWHPAVVVSRTDLTAEHYKARGEELIKKFYRRNSPFNTDLTIGTEMKLDFSLDDSGKYKMLGYVDRLSRLPDGTFAINDYKTSVNLPTQQAADGDRQLGLYHIGVQRKWPNAQNIRLVWHYLDFETELVSERTPQAISALIQSTKRLIDIIEADTVFSPRESASCEWCEYLDICPRTKHGFMVRELPLEEYLSEPGVVLVNKYAELKAEARRIDEEIDRIKEKLVDYAKNNDAEVIKGNGYKVSVTFSEKLKFPGKRDEGRDELEGIIRGAGKWDEVSTLDTHALQDVLEEGTWKQDLLDEIREYGELEQSSSVRLSKLREEDIGELE